MVEDNAPLREALAKRLRSDGFAVDEAGDGKEGLWLAVENNGVLHWGLAVCF